MSPHSVHGLGGQGPSISKDSGRSGISPKHWIMGQEAFEARMPHHDGIEALWETKWKFPVSASVNRHSPLYHHLQQQPKCQKRKEKITDIYRETIFFL